MNVGWDSLVRMRGNVNLAYAFGNPAVQAGRVMRAKHAAHDQCDAGLTDDDAREKASASFIEEGRCPSFVRHLRHHVVVHHRHVAMHVDLILDELGQ